MKGFPRFIKAFLFLFLFVFIVFPFIPLVLSSVSFGWQWPNVLPESFSLSSWEYVLFGSSDALRAIGVSLLIALIVTAVNVVLAVPAANALARYQIKGKWLVEAILLRRLSFRHLWRSWESI
nr:hypothetical protein [Planococcus glaciei]